jgi:hypothetical protein
MMKMRQIRTIISLSISLAKSLVLLLQSRSEVNNAEYGACDLVGGTVIMTAPRTCLPI